MASLYRFAHFDEARIFVVRWHTSWSAAVADKEEREASAPRTSSASSG